MTEFVATLVPTESPKSNGVAETSAGKGNESGDDYVVVFSTELADGTGGGLGSSAVDVSAKGKSVVGSTGVLATGKSLLERGKIDRRAQDEFIAIILGKK